MVGKIIHKFIKNNTKSANCNSTNNNHIFYELFLQLLRCFKILFCFYMCFSDICRHAVLYAVNCICSKLNFFLKYIYEWRDKSPLLASFKFAPRKETKSKTNFVCHCGWKRHQKNTKKKKKKWSGRESGTCHPPKAPTRYLIKYFPCYMVMQEEEQKEPPERI